VPTKNTPFASFALISTLALNVLAIPAFAQNGKANLLPTPYLQSLHKKMVAGRSLGTKELRALADAADGLAAFRYGKWLEQQGKPQLLPDAAHYYAIASYTDRDFAVRSLVALLALPDLALTETRLKEALDALTLQAKTGNAEAALALSKMYVTGHPFGKNPEAMLKWLEVAAKSGRGDAAIKLALAYMAPTDGQPANLDKARKALDLAATLPDPGTKAMAQTLLARLDSMPSPLPSESEGVSE
jgi:TPR repeat protein